MINQSTQETDTAAQIIQRKWREYKLSRLLGLSDQTKHDLLHRSKLVLLASLMKHTEFKRILNTLSQLTQQWKDFTTKNSGVKRVTNALASCDENNYISISEGITLLLKSNKETRQISTEF